MSYKCPGCGARHPENCECTETADGESTCESCGESPAKNGQCNECREIAEHERDV